MDDSGEFPNLFIVGAPRCGTTSMHWYLGQHPQIFMSDPKEPYYFLTDMPHRERFGREDYLALFSAAGDVPYRGESSVWYLYSRAAAGAIKACSPEARIIILLRNPIDALYSLHARSLHTANEDIFDFEAALDAESDRRDGRRIPRTAFFPMGLQYREVVHFAPQVRRFYEHFGRDAVDVIIFDDLIRDTEGIYRRTLQHLGVDDEFPADLSPMNATATLPNLAIQRLLRRNAFMRSCRAVMRRVVPVAAINRVQVVLGRSTQRQRPASIDPALRARLQREMLPEVEELSELLERDLTGWCRGS